MFLKNEKKKQRPLLAIGIGAMALYGAYSAVSCAKEMCVKRMNMLTKVFKSKPKCNKNDEKCEDLSDECEA